MEAFDLYTTTDIATSDLSCAIKNLRIVREEMEEELLRMRNTQIYLGPDYLLDCCDAMSSAFVVLDAIYGDLCSALRRENGHKQVAGR